MAATTLRRSTGAFTAIAVACALAVVAAGASASTTAGAGPTVGAKKRCKIVVKKIHGKRKKVRVCHKVKPKPHPPAPPPPPPPPPTTIFSDVLGPRGLTLDAQGNVYVADEGATGIVKLSPSGQVLARLGTDLRTPVKVALDGQGNLWVSEHHADRIAELAPDGQVLRRLGHTGRAAGELDHPNGIVLDPSGNLYIADHFNNRIQELAPGGVALGEWHVFLPFDLALDATRNMYVTGDALVEKLSPSGAVLTSYAPVVDPRGIALDATGNVYVGDNGVGKILVFSPSGQLLRTYGAGIGSAPGQLKVPADVAVDAAGNVYVAEGDPEDGSGCNCRVQKFSPSGDVLAVWR